MRAVSGMCHTQAHCTGWSASTTVRMARRYGHIGQNAQRQAVNTLNEAGFLGDGAQKLGTVSKAARATTRQLIEKVGSPG
jgi:hypothetical protein